MPASAAPGSQDLSLASTPVVVMGYEALIELPLDARQGFLLWLMDGACTVENILDMCGFERGEAIQMLAGLVRQGVVVLKEPTP
jgi:hypothetical protein